jgi:hypothetical protein
MHGTIEDRLSALEKTVKEVDDAVYGRWDTHNRKRSAGLLEQITALTNIMKWAIVPMMVANTLLQFGLKDAIPAAMKLVSLAVAR